MIPLTTLLLASFPPKWSDGLTLDNTGGVQITSLDDITLVVINLIHIATALAGVLAVCFIVYGGIKYVMSDGDPARVSKAKGTVVNAFVGVIIASLAYVVVGYVTSLFSAAT